MAFDFRGTGVAMVTPFDNQGEIDFPALKKLTQHLIDGKVEYLVVLGTTGETATLTREEQYRVIDTVSEVNQGQLPVVLGAGGNHTPAVAQSMTDLVNRYKPAALLSASPYYNKPTQEGIYQHYRHLAEATDTPIILYNVPGRTASNMSSETTLRLAHDFPTIRAVKEASGNLQQCMEILRDKPGDFHLISGDDPLTLPLISLGGSGVISVIGNAFAFRYSEMVRMALANNFEKARELHFQLLRITELCFAEGNPAGIKLLLNLMNICEPQVRLPLIAGSDHLRGQIQKVLAAI